MSLLQRARALRSAQSQAAAADRIEQAAETSRAARIDRIERVSIPGEESKETEQRGLATAAEEELLQLEGRQDACDGSEAALDAIERQRRAILERIRRATNAAEQHKRNAETFHNALRDLKETERLEQLRWEGS